MELLVGYHTAIAVRLHAVAAVWMTKDCSPEVVAWHVHDDRAWIRFAWHVHDDTAWIRFAWHVRDDTAWIRFAC